MVEQNGKMEALRKEIAYYKRQCDKLTAANMKLDWKASRLNSALVKKQKGFALLSELQQSIGAHKKISSIFEIAIGAINASLGMDRTLVLTPTDEEHAYRPSLWAGFHQETVDRFASRSFKFPQVAATGSGFLTATKSTEPTRLIEDIRTHLDLPFFVCVPVEVDDSTIGLLLTGRLKEEMPFYPPFDQGDVDTLQAIAGLIAASIQNLRLAVFEEMDRLKSEFYANISHEFRTPITLTIGPLEQIMSGRYGEISQGVHENCLVIRQNQERLLGLVNQILDLTKMEGGRMQLKAGLASHLNRFIKERTAQFDSLAEERGIELRMELDPNVEGADLYIDLENFEKVFLNLLSNAFKFTNEGWIEIKTRIDKSKFNLVICDTGIGIKSDQLPHIFDRFHQADGSESRQYSGTGIGLALAKQITELHGGTIKARSLYGKGSAFQVSLPLGKTHLDATSIAEVPYDLKTDSKMLAASLIDTKGPADYKTVDCYNKEAESTFDKTRSIILYVEDNPELRNHVRDLLTPEYNVFLAEDGNDGLEKATHYVPDLIITDQMMPRMSGKDLLNAVRADPELRSIPMIFLTARAGTNARIESLSAGADDYLTKPFNQAELIARVRNLLRARAQERELAKLNQRLEARVEEQMAELLRSGDLKRFLPPSLVEGLFAGQIELDGESFERRRVTALFADIVGFTPLTNRLEPEEIAVVINEYLSEMTAIAVAHGGMIEKFIGDAVVVLFGAPKTSDVETQVWSSLQTAIEMRVAVNNLSTHWRHRGLSGQVSLRIGINTGYCTVGVFGSDILKNYAALGNPINIAARLQAEASPGTILCGFSSYAVVKDRVRVKERGMLSLKGISHPVEAYEILALTG
jgi:adenylate cyclase